MNKKGILISNAVKMVIAVVCLILLFYTGVSLAGIFTQKTGAQQAKANLEDLERTINSLEEGGTTQFVLLSPSGWEVVGFSGENMRVPNECSQLKNCLCLCNLDESILEFSQVYELCEKNGYCIEINEKEISVNNRRFYQPRINPISIDSLVKNGEHLLIKKENIKDKDEIRLIIEAEKDGSDILIETNEEGT